MTLSIQADTQDCFSTVADAVRGQFAKFHGQPLFTVSTEGLFNLYLDGFPPGEERQHHTCGACRKFIEAYGGTVAVDQHGILRSVFWDEDRVPATYKDAVRNLRQNTVTQPIESVLYTDASTWGVNQTPDLKRGKVWSHFFIQTDRLFVHKLLTPTQFAAQQKEDVAILERSLEDFSHETVQKAVTLLQTEQLYRSEKVLGVAEWFLKLQTGLQCAGKHTPATLARRKNLVWKAAVQAPVGFCHVRSSMIGTLLADLESGADFEDVKRRFADKMHPLQYQRAQVAPTAGNLAEAEKVIAEMRSAGSLERRFAKLEDIQTIWKPRRSPTIATNPDGVFGHLEARPRTFRQKVESIGGTVTMTWEKFRKNVLPTAEALEVLPPSIGNYFAFVTAANPDAPNIMQWDNPASWYVYHRGSTNRNWNLDDDWVNVTGVALAPNMWNPDHPQPHHGERVGFILEGARDTRYTCSGGFFCENLLSVYRPIRATLEAYMTRAVVAGAAEATACGVMLVKGEQSGPHDILVRVTAGALQTTYRLDRWD